MIARGRPCDVIAISVYVIGMVILLQFAGDKKQMKEG